MKDRGLSADSPLKQSEITPAQSATVHPVSDAERSSQTASSVRGVAVPPTQVSALQTVLGNRFISRRLAAQRTESPIPPHPASHHVQDHAPHPELPHPEQHLDGASSPAVHQVWPMADKNSGLLQRQWIFVVHDMSREDRTRDQYYWNATDGPEPTLAPGIGRKLRLTRLPPQPRVHAYNHVPESQYTTMNSGGNQGGSRSNTYNPFGRFNDNLTMTAYIPFQGDPDLRATADTHGTITSVGGDTGTSLPAWVITTTSTPQRLSLIAIDPFGATYGDGPPLASGAIFPIAKQIRLPSGIPAKAQAILSELGEQSVNALDIDQGIITGYQGGRGSEDQQKTIMGVSADEMATAAGYDEAIDQEYANDKSTLGKKKHGWEWLHMVSYALGGPTATGPQVATNLVVGTTAANTAMIMIEDAINSMITEKLVRSATVHVKPIMANADYRIASTIIYSVTFILNDGREMPLPEILFSALLTSTPFVATNKYLRAMVKYHIRQKDQEVQVVDKNRMIW